MALPRGGELRDLVALGLLTLVAIGGFHRTYGGTRYLIAGAVGTAAGLTLGWIAVRRRWPAIVTAALTIVVFFVLGVPAAVPDRGLGGVLPTPDALTALADGAVGGWARLLTTLPPVGSTGSLLTVPFLCGLVSGVVASVVARRCRRVWWVASILPVAVLVLAILFGTTAPVSVLLQGASFGAVLLGWVALRARERRTVADLGGRSSSRWIGVAVTLVAAGAISLVLAPRLPGAGDYPRLVLRDRSQPPFDPRTQPSPLTSFRRYTRATLLRDKVLFEVRGLDSGSFLRVAALDAYDGLVYGFGADRDSSGTYRATGEQIASDVDGPRREVELTVRAYKDVWLPTSGPLTDVSFAGPRAPGLREAFRYNTATSSAVVESAVRDGDRIRFTAVDPPEPKVEDLVDLGPAKVLLGAPAAVESLPARARADAAGAGKDASPWERVQAIRTQMIEKGRFSDGEPSDALPSKPGHFVDRLKYMVQPGGYLVGNDEQYAPLVALMAREVGVPARVVMGFEVPAAGPDGVAEVKGENVAARVEVALDGVGWVDIGDVVPTNTDEPEPQPQDPTPSKQSAPPPPPPVLPTTDDGDADANRSKNKAGRKNATERDGILGTVLTVGGVAATPFALLGGVTVAIGGLKGRRRKRRRFADRAHDRVAGGWEEILDLTTDLGRPVPDRTTRLEAAAFVGPPAVRHVAAHADARIFGAGEPTEDQIAAFWNDVEGARTEMTTDLNKFERWKATVNLASFRHARRRGAARS